MREVKDFPNPISLRKLIGPSFVILALGLGSGEVILWPYLASNYGLGILWGAFLGITFQYIINMEIERYTLVTGESVFVGFYKLFKPILFWFIISTFIGFGLPGIVAASAQIISHVLGFESFKLLAIFFLILIGMILSVGKTVYKMMESITKTIIIFGVPFILLLVILLSNPSDFVSAIKGFVGFGDGFIFLPKDIHIATFLAAFAYSGAGGNLNLTQSLYIKEKGYGMGFYSQKLFSLFSKNRDEEVKIDGFDCKESEENISKFKKWWRMISLEHIFIFWLVGLLSIILLMVLSFTTTYGIPSNKDGISFVFYESQIIGSILSPFFGSLFLLVLGVMLFQTQLGIMDSTSRIMSENFAIWKVFKKGQKTIKLSLVYSFFVWAQIVFGIILFLFNIYEPKSLIITGAVINAFAMFVHTIFIFWLNTTKLPKSFKPSFIRKLLIIFIFSFFGIFSFIVLFDKLF
jgi:hypothetical protein